MVGKTIGHYEILEPLGKGGMGEVYRARDTKLERDVAIKVLPEDLADNPDRLARLQREAKLLAALNHPNIATIHALEVDQGARFLVLELVKGESLEQRLSSGPLPVEKALDVCKQIAEALEAAHGEGIIHRDLKPANVLITPEGKAKVLDFGIAKSMQVDTETAATAHATNLTVAGTFVGTPSYMSPEQVRGGVVDKRVDIWAFGCLLFETLTAKSAYAKETMADTLAAIVDQEPDWNALSNETPRQVRHLIKRCLRKDPQRRLHDIADARIEIEDSLSGDTDAMSAMLAGPAVAEITRGIPWKLAAAIAVAGVLLGAFAVRFTIPSPPESLIRRFYIDYPPETRFESLSTLGVAISPDGKSVVFNADRQLWLRAIDDLVAIPIRGTEQGRVPFFSPDGQQLGFWGEDGQMKSVSITGGAPVSLGPAPEQAYGASWADDGYIYFGQAAGGILRVPEDGGDPKVVVEMEEGEQAHGPQLLPGGEWLLFTLRSGSTSWNDASIVVQPMTGGERKLLVGGTDGRYVPTGHIVYSLDGNLRAVPFDADSIEVTGVSVPIVEGVRQASAGITGASQYAFSGRGGLIYLPAGGAGDLRKLVWVDREGGVEPIDLPSRAYSYARLSPDGTRLAVNIIDRNIDVWISELARGTFHKLTFDLQGDFAPLWTPDGKRVVFTSFRETPRGLFSKAFDGTVAAERFLTLDEDGILQAHGWSPDGKSLVFRFTTRATSGDIGVLTTSEGESDWEPLIHTEALEDEPAISPDGRSIAYVSSETGRMEVYVQRFPELGQRRLVSTSGGRKPLWSPDGREMVYANAGALIVVPIETESDFRLGPPETVFESSEGLDDPGVGFSDIAPDGQRFLLNLAGTAAGSAAAPQINVVLNWFEELKERVPTGR